MDRVTKRIQPDVVLYAGKHKQYETSDIPEEVNSAGVREILQHLADYEDTGLEPETCAEYKKFEDEVVSKGVTFKRIIELMDAEKDGRLVVLPFPVHSVLFNMSDLDAPVLMKDFRISATWTHHGIVLHSPWEIFSELVKAGSIDRVSQEAEAALKGRGGDES